MAIPKEGEILISEHEEGGARARLRSETGYIIHIEVLGNEYSPCFDVLNDYLDELGYDKESRLVTDENKLLNYDLFDGQYKRGRW